MWSPVHPLYAGKRLYPPTLLCISDKLAPRLIQSTSCNVSNRKKKNFETVVCCLLESKGDQQFCI